VEEESAYSTKIFPTAGEGGPVGWREGGEGRGGKEEGRKGKRTECFP